MGTLSLKYSWKFKLESVDMSKNGEYVVTPEKRFELVAKVLAGHFIASAAKNTHIVIVSNYYLQKSLIGFI